MTRRRAIKLEDLPGNTESGRNRSRPSKPVDITGSVRVRSQKTSGLAYHLKMIANALFQELILPSIQRMSLDFITQGAEMLIMNKVTTQSRQHSRQGVVRYDQMSRGRGRRRQNVVHRSMSTADIVDDIFFDDSESASRVLDRLLDNIDDFGIATVGDLRQAVGFSTDITHEKYGWTNLRGVGIIYTTDGYLIDLPQVSYLR